MCVIITCRFIKRIVVQHHLLSPFETTFLFEWEYTNSQTPLCFYCSSICPDMYSWRSAVMQAQSCSRSTHTGPMKQGCYNWLPGCEERPDGGMYRYTDKHLHYSSQHWESYLWGMAEFCSSCSVVDTVRHHAKALTHICFVTVWVLPSASCNCTGMSTTIHSERRDTPLPAFLIFFLHWFFSSVC